MTLEFADQSLEQGFREAYFDQHLNFWRICHLLAVLFYAVFAAWDTLVIEPQRLVAWATVTGVVALVFAAGLTLSYVDLKLYRRIFEPLHTGYVLVTGLGVSAVAIWAGSTHLKLYVGIIYCLTFNYSMIRLRFRWAAPVGWVIVLAYIFSVWAFTRPSHQVLATEAFMLTGVSLLGMFISYTMETYLRRDYLLTQRLVTAQEETRAINAGLEIKVAERTQELRAANEALQETIARERATSQRLSEEEKLMQRHLAYLQQAERMAALGTLEIDWVQGDHYWSAGLYRLLGKEAGSIEPSVDYLFERMAPQDHDRVRAYLLDRFARGGVMELGFRLVREDGLSIDLHGMASTRCGEDGRPLSTLGVFQDVSEQKRAEEERAVLESQLRQAHKMESLGTLAGGIAHDFNNILAAISGYSELALDAAHEDRAAPHELNQILAAAGRAKDLVQKILAFGRKAAYQSRPLDLNRVVREAVSMIERTIPKMISVEMDLAPDLWAVSGDATQLEQVVLNLAGNSRDAMPMGGTLRLATANVHLDQEPAPPNPGMAGGDYVRLTVGDTGMGMDQEVLNHVFEPFYTTKEIGKGTGLGLASAYGIVKAHGGVIEGQSQSGVGTTFAVYLPASPGVAVVEEGEGDDPETLASGSETILVVDDESALRDIARRILSPAGYQVLLAESGEEALEIMQGQGPGIDLVLLDIGMPGMGGLRCLDLLLRRRPGLRVVITSGYAKSGSLEATLDLGARTYVTKPFRRAELLRTVRLVLDE